MRSRAVAVVAAVTVGVLATTACVGATPREEFIEVVQERGGGFTSASSLAAVDAVREQLGETDFRVRTFSMSTQGTVVTMEVRDPAAPQNLDRYVVDDGRIRSVDPVVLEADAQLETGTFPVSTLRLDRVDAMVDAALAAFGVTDGYVASMRVSGPAGSRVITASLESPRARATATFTLDGDLLDVERS